MARTLAALLSVACICFIPAAGHADSFSFNASGTANGGDGPLSASALITTGNGTVTITLTNTLSASTIRDNGQALSDISFTLSGTPGAITGSSASGQLGNISSGVVTYAAGDPNRWIGTGHLGISGNILTLDVIGGGQPSEMIFPNLVNGGTYTNLNPGMDFNPYVIGPGTFVIDLPGVNMSTTVSDVTFSFGTGPDTDLPGTPAPIPEPSSLLLLGTGILGAAGAMRSRLAWGLKRA